MYRTFLLYEPVMFLDGLSRVEDVRQVLVPDHLQVLRVEPELVPVNAQSVNHQNPERAQKNMSKSNTSP